MWHIIWVFTAYLSTRLGASRIRSVKSAHKYVGTFRSNVILTVVNETKVHVNFITIEDSIHVINSYIAVTTMYKIY